MRFWFDTEFIEDGRTIDLISIGIVSEDGREYYAEAPCDLSRACPWVQEHVLPHLTGKRISRSQIASDIREFVDGPTKPEFWAYYADYDWVALCQLYGRMIDLPEGWPKFCRDLKQLAGDIRLPEQTSTEHHALADARWNKIAWDIAMRAGRATVIDEIAAERKRQVEEEGWTAEHDDTLHCGGQLALAASVYAICGSSDGRVRGDSLAPSIIEMLWPWEWSWFKPKVRRRNLIRSGALIVAEIERLDRITQEQEKRLWEKQRRACVG